MVTCVKVELYIAFGVIRLDDWSSFLRIFAEAQGEILNFKRSKSGGRMLDFWKSCNGKVIDNAVSSAHISEMWG
jgi:hypothetical protein